MAQGVVYDLEPVEVHEHDRHHAVPPTTGPFESMPKTVYEDFAVGQTSEGVVQCLALESLFHALALGYVLEIDRQPRLGGIGSDAEPSPKWGVVCLEPRRSAFLHCLAVLGVERG